MRVLLSICLFVSSYASFALDLDREKFNVSYMQLPEKPIVNPKNRNYSIYYNSAYKNHEFQRLIEDNFHINGFTRFDTNATIRLDFQFEDLKVFNTEVLEDDRTVKDADGKKYTEYFYVPVITYATSAQVFVNYANGESKVFSFGNKKNKFTGEEAYSTNEANIALTSKLYQVVFEEQKRFILETTLEMKSKLNDIHGYKPVEKSDYLLILDSRRYPEYKDYKRYYQLTTRLFDQMNPFDSIESIKTEMQPVIDFLMGIPAKYPEDKKAHVKMRYASYYNIAKIYYYLEELEKAIDYYEKVIENDYHEGQSKRNIKDINQLKDLFAVNHVNTRHLDIELFPRPQVNVPQNYEPNSSQMTGVQYIDAEIQTIDTKWTEGKIELNAEVQDIIDELQNLTVIDFKYLNDSEEIAVKKIYISTINSIQLKDTKLRKIHFVSQQHNSNEAINTGKIKEGVLISVLAHELFASDRIALFSFNGELILLKSGEQTGTSTSSTAFSFGFKKKLGQFLSDCPQMQSTIKSGKYRNDVDGLMNVAKDYSLCSP